MLQILVVEDDPSTNEEITKLLESIEDTRVQSVLTRQDALDLIARESFDLAVIDIDLGSEKGRPGKYAGLGLMPALAQKGTVTVVVSGLAEDAIPEVALELRAFDFVSKPFRTTDFLNKVNHALALKKASSASEAEQIKDSLQHSKLQIDPDHTPGLLWMGKPVRISLTQYRLIFKLLKTPGQVVTRSALADEMDTAGASHPFQ